MAQITIDGIAVSATGFVLGGASAGPRRRGGDPPGMPELDPLDALLRSADFSVAAKVEVAALGEGSPLRRGPAERQVALDVPVAPGESAVLLVEDDAGLLTWHLPQPPAPAAAARRRGGGGAPEMLSFRLTPMPSGQPPEARRRGLVTDWIAGKIAEPVRVRVLRFLVSHTIDALTARIEGGVTEGPVVIARGSSPESWVPATLSPALLAAPPQRVLLLVHGTFSTTAGSFAALAGTPLLDGMHGGYDLVLGHDHHTLGADPRANAEAILATLHALQLPAGCVIDAVAYSRGGLVLRTLGEVLLPRSGRGLALRNAVFVGCTNAGTALAEPDNWEDLVNVYTNIVAAAVKGGGLLLGPAASAAAPWVAYAIRTLGRFVQMLPQVAISERRLPGLAAMEPDGEVVRALNGAAPAPGFATRYHAVTSDFEPGDGPGLGRRAAMFLADRVLDRLLRQKNDLVVHTASMTDFGAGRKAENVLALDAGGHVFHTVYFASPAAMAPIAGWLGLTGPKVTAASPLSANVWRGGLGALPTGGVSVRSDDLRERPRRSAPRTPPSDRHGMAGIETPPAAQVAAPPVERHIAAEMEPSPRLGQVANVYVTVSPEPIAVAAHAAAATTGAPVAVRPDLRIALHCIPRSNCETVGIETCEIDPARTDEVISRFRVRGLAAGPAELLVEARQGTRTLASFLLRPIFVGDVPLVESQPMVALGDPPPDLAVLRIYEFRGAENIVLRFDLASESADLSLLETTLLPRDFDLRQYAADTLKEVEDAWNLSTGDGEEKIYNSLLRKLSNKARDRTAGLIPEKIRRALWRARAGVRTIQVISEEPYIPWELLYLSDPDGIERDGEGFFAERGLMRWLHNAPMRRLPALDGAQARYVIPDYLNPADRLPGAAEERAMLERRLPGIAAVPATSEDVVAFLSGGAGSCTVLHFACHGNAKQAAVIDAALSMTEQRKGANGPLMPDTLTWQDVQEGLDFGPGPGPLVFVNACQTGQAGGGIVGTAGFADAFIRPTRRRGASVFIGALWSVDDRLATRFADTIYAELGEGKPLTDAVRAAREACKANFDFTWLAYSVYSAA